MRKKTENLLVEAAKLARAAFSPVGSVEADDDWVNKLLRAADMLDEEEKAGRETGAAKRQVASNAVEHIEKGPGVAGDSDL